jgi:hypothetical protein
MDLIARLYAGAFDGARGKFQHVNRFEDGTDTPWTQRADGAQHAQVAVQKNHIYGKPHPDGVDTTALIDEQPITCHERLAVEQTNHAFEHRVRE